MEKSLDYSLRCHIFVLILISDCEKKKKPISHPKRESAEEKPSTEREAMMSDETAVVYESPEQSPPNPLSPDAASIAAVSRPLFDSAESPAVPAQPAASSSPAAVYPAVASVPPQFFATSSPPSPKSHREQERRAAVKKHRASRSMAHESASGFPVGNNSALFSAPETRAQYHAQLEAPQIPMMLAPGLVVITVLGSIIPPPPDVICFVCGSAACPVREKGKELHNSGEETAEMRSFFWPCRCGPAHRCCFLEFQLNTWTPTALYNCAVCNVPIRMHTLSHSCVVGDPAAVAADNGGDDSSNNNADAIAISSAGNSSSARRPEPPKTVAYSFDPKDEIDLSIRRQFVQRCLVVWLVVSFVLAACAAIWATICWTADPEKNIPIFFRMISSSVAGGSPAEAAIEAWRVDFKKPDTPTWPSYGGMGVLITSISVLLVALVAKMYEECCSDEKLAPQHRWARDQSCCSTCDNSGCCFYCRLGSTPDGGGGGGGGWCGTFVYNMDRVCCRDCADTTCCCCSSNCGSSGGGDSAAAETTSSGCCCRGAGGCDTEYAAPVFVIIVFVIAIAVILSAVFIAVYFAASRMREFHSAAMAAALRRIELAHRKTVILGVGEYVVSDDASRRTGERNNSGAHSSAV